MSLPGRAFPPNPMQAGMFSSSRIRTRRLAELCRRMGISLETGIDLRTILAREKQRGSSAQRWNMGEVSRRVDQGGTLSDSLTACGNFFPPLVRELVQVGEQTGKLDAVLLRLADHYEHRLRLRQIFLAGITWPMIQLAVAVIIVGLLIWIMGLVSKMTGENVDLLGLGLVGNRGLTAYATCLGMIALSLALLYQLAQSGLFATPLQALVFRLPGLGTSLRTLALSQMAWTLSLTADTEMNARRSILLAVRSTRSRYYTRHLDDIDQHIASGGPVHEALRRTGDYPEDFLDALEVGETSGRLPESMAVLSQQYQERARAALATLTMLAGFAVWALVAALIIALIFRLAMFYIGTINSALEGL